MPSVLNIRHCPNRSVPAGAVYIGRGLVLQYHGLPASKWANPFRIGPDGTRAEVITKYAAWLPTQLRLMAALPELEGRDLVCWCAPRACHGDVLLKLANT